MPERELIVSADDIGLTRENTRTILETVDRGAVTSVSILANGFAFDTAAAECRKRPVLRVATHLNLTEGKPLSRPEDVPHLIDAIGSFKYSPATLWTAYLFGGPQVQEALRREVKAELSAQIQKVHSMLPASVSVDGHQHVHMIPFVFDVLCSVPGIGEIRIPDEGFVLARGRYTLSHDLAALMFSLLASRARASAARAGVRTNDAFVGVIFSGCMTEHTARAGLAAATNRHPQRTEILFHPGSAVEGELAGWKGDTAWHFRDARRTEHAFLTGEKAKEIFAAFRAVP